MRWFEPVRNQFTNRFAWFVILRDEPSEPGTAGFRGAAKNKTARAAAKRVAQAPGSADLEIDETERAAGVCALATATEKPVALVRRVCPVDGCLARGLPSKFSEDSSRTSAGFAKTSAEPPLTQRFTPSSTGGILPPRRRRRHLQRRAAPSAGFLAVTCEGRAALTPPSAPRKRLGGPFTPQQSTNEV